MGKGTKYLFPSNKKEEIIMIIFYDMDNTIVEMQKKLTGISSGRSKQYEAKNEAEKMEIINKLNTEGFFQDLTIIQRANSVLKKLVNNGYDVRILSQPMERPSSIDEKNYCLNTFFPYIPRYKRIYTFDKWLLAAPGRILVDDNVSHLLQWEENKGLSVCFRRGYNKHYHGIGIKHHSEIFQLLESLKKTGWI